MHDPLGAVKSQFTGATAAYAAALAARALPALVGGVRRHRRLLRHAPALPALAVELGDVRAEAAGAGGLMALEGTATLWLALGRADEDALLDAGEDYLDALREAVETTLKPAFQRLVFAGARAEGEAWADAGIHLRLFPLAFGFTWLYQIDAQE